MRWCANAKSHLRYQRSIYRFSISAGVSRGDTDGERGEKGGISIIKIYVEQGAFARYTWVAGRLASLSDHNLARLPFQSLSLSCFERIARDTPMPLFALHYITLHYIRLGWMDGSYRAPFLPTSSSSTMHFFTSDTPSSASDSDSDGRKRQDMPMPMVMRNKSERRGTRTRLH